MNISKEISASFMVTNLISIILVIAIHYGSKGHLEIMSGHNFNFILQESITNGLARSAVPFFALSSGFFLKINFVTLGDYNRILLNKFYTLCIPYFIASTIIFISCTSLKVIFGHDINEIFNTYFILRTIVAHPITIQFWFLRDLMILVIISPLFMLAPKKITLLICFGLMLLWITDTQPLPIIAGWYILNIETLFFFVLGGSICILNINIRNIIFARKYTKVFIFTTWVSLIAYRIYIDPELDVWYVQNYTLLSITLYKIAIIIGVISIMQISTTMIGNKFIVYTSGLTFFVYLFHLAPLSYFKYFTSKIIDPPYSFYINFPLATLLSFVFAHIMSSYFNKPYRLTCGGRCPSKSLRRLSK